MPSTFRPRASITELAKVMVDHDLDSSPVTTSDGRLVGLLLRLPISLRERSSACSTSAVR